MNVMSTHRPRGARFTLALLALIGMAAAGYAQKVTADLSQDITAIGQPVQLNVSVVGGGGAKMPGRIEVEGLDIRLAGRSEQVNVVNFQMTVSSIYSYLVVPQREGDFVIPSITVTIGGKKYETQPLTLRVGGNSGGVPVLPAQPVPGRSGGYGQMPQMPPSSMPQVQQPTAPPNQRRAPAGEGRLAFGDLIVPKKTAYVGEVIPAEIRFYFNASCPARLERPVFSGDGFTVMKLGKPAELQQEIDGQLYNVVSFKTAITAVKAGTLEIAPATIDAEIHVPSRHSPATDDFFGGLFGNSGFGMDARQMTVETKPMTLEVKPLPAEGKPDEFSGAIGQFSLAATASPKKTEAGDPVTLNVTVSGRGNFEGMAAPILQDAQDWKSYAPGERFESSPSDPIGFNGKKIFDYMIVARTDATQTPVPEFSYFDPDLEKYVTLKGAPIAVVAQGTGPAAQPAASAVAAATPGATPAAAAPAVPEATPAVAGSTEGLVFEHQPGTFQPLLYSRGFIVSHAVALLACLALVAFGVVRVVNSSSYARKAGERREIKRLLGILEDPATEPDTFFTTVEKFVHARVAPDAPPFQTRDALQRSSASAEVREKVAAVLDRADERKYAAGYGAVALGADERQQIIINLKALDESL